MKRRLWFISVLLAAAVAAGGAFAQAVLQTDALGRIIQPGIGGFKLGVTHTAVANSGQNTISALTTGTKVVLLVCSVACHVSQGVSPVVVFTSSFLVPANTLLQLKVTDTDSIAVIADTTVGTMYVVELN